nr:hypothetical protein [Tanacetum cinerariifolium]
MDMTIDQQVALDEALVPHASRLRTGKRNFHLRSGITSKESTLQLVYDVLRLTPFYKWRDKEAHCVNINKLHQPWRSFTAIINKCLSRKSTGYDCLRNSEAYKEYYAVATGAAPPKTKESVKKTKSIFDITVTLPTDFAGTRLSTSAKGKQPAKA